MNRLSTLTLFLLTIPVFAQDAKKAAKVDFEKQILPILEKNCIECHGTPAAAKAGERPKKPKGGVTLDGKDGILKSKRGKVVVAKKPDDSLIYALTTLDAESEDIMPPKKSKKAPLTKEQTDLIKTWIEQGAEFGKWVGKKAEAGKGTDEGDDKGTDKPKESGHGHEEPAPKGGKKKNGESPLAALARTAKALDAEALSAFDKGPFGSAR